MRYYCDILLFDFGRDCEYINKLQYLLGLKMVISWIVSKLEGIIKSRSEVFKPKGMSITRAMVSIQEIMVKTTVV